MEESDESLWQIAAEVGAQIDQAGAESGGSVQISPCYATRVPNWTNSDRSRRSEHACRGAANFAPRLVLFVVKGTNALAWSREGWTIKRNGQIRGFRFHCKRTRLAHGLNSQQLLRFPGRSG